MQIFLCALIIIAAACYLANRWLPHQLRQPLMDALGSIFARIFGKTIITTKQPNNACSSCSSCGNCGSQLVNPIIMRKK